MQTLFDGRGDGQGGHYDVIEDDDIDNRMPHLSYYYLIPIVDLDAFGTVPSGWTWHVSTWTDAQWYGDEYV